MGFYKLISIDLIYPAPLNGKLEDGTAVSNLPSYFADHPDAAAACGYYPLQESEKPEGEYRAIYSMGEGKILQEWEEIEPDPEPGPTIEERLAALEAENAALKAAIEEGVMV